MSKNVQVLFVTWDGPNSTYLEALFLPILAALRERGFDFHVLQFTWGNDRERAAIARSCRAARVVYRSASIWRRPLALGSLVTAIFGIAQVRRAMRAHQIQLLLPRSTFPAMAAIPAAGHGRRRVPVLLDADGLPHDERVEFAGASSRGISYRLLRRLEAWSVRRADAVTVRTSRAIEILSQRAAVGAERFHVVANARDASLFRAPSNEDRRARRREMGVVEGQPLLVYVGTSLSGKYRGEDMLRFFREVRALRADARLLLLMPNEHEARVMLARHSDLAPHCIMRSAAPNEVPAWVGAGDLGLALIHATFSMQAVSAIKVGEYLLCGVPVLASSGVGDTDTLVDGEVGRCLSDYGHEGLSAGARWFVHEVLSQREAFRQRCRARGLEHYSLECAIDGYEAALRAALAARFSE